MRLGVTHGWKDALNLFGVKKNLKTQSKGVNQCLNNNVKKIIKVFLLIKKTGFYLFLAISTFNIKCAVFLAHFDKILRSREQSYTYCKKYCCESH